MSGAGDAAGPVAGLDGLEIGYLPAGVGGLVEDFGYESDDVTFASRVWERVVDDGHRVDLQIVVLRGSRLFDVPALREFLVEYEGRDPLTWQPTEITVGVTTAFIGEGEAYWLVEPGLAVTVRLDPERFAAEELTSVVGGIRPVGAGG